MEVEHGKYVSRGGELVEGAKHTDRGRGLAMEGGKYVSGGREWLKLGN